MRFLCKIGIHCWHKKRNSDWVKAEIGLHEKINLLDHRVKWNASEGLTVFESCEWIRFCCKCGKEK